MVGREAEAVGGLLLALRGMVCGAAWSEVPNGERDVLIPGEVPNGEFSLL